MWLVTCPLDDFHHVGGEVAHAVIPCAIVVNTAFPPAIWVLLQNLQTHTVYGDKLKTSQQDTGPAFSV